MQTAKLNQVIILISISIFSHTSVHTKPIEQLINYFIKALSAANQPTA